MRNYRKVVATHGDIHFMYRNPRIPERVTARPFRRVLINYKVQPWPGHTCQGITPRIGRKPSFYQRVPRVPLMDAAYRPCPKPRMVTVTVSEVEWEAFKAFTSNTCDES